MSSPLPKENTIEKQRLLNRVNELRVQGDFDSTIDLYQKAIIVNPDDPEVYFSLALSKHGIEYVNDTKTNELVPVCHRLQNQNILSDHDFLKAI